MEITLDSDAIQVLLQKAVLEELTPEKREQLLSNAVTHLLSGKVYTHHGSPTNLQEIFNFAVAKKAGELIEVELVKPEVLEKFHSIVQESVTKVLAPEGEARAKIVESMVSAIRRTLTGERW